MNIRKFIALFLLVVALGLLPGIAMSQPLSAALPTCAVHIDASGLPDLWVEPSDDSTVQLNRIQACWAAMRPLLSPDAIAEIETPAPRTAGMVGLRSSATERMCIKVGGQKVCY